MREKYKTELDSIWMDGGLTLMANSKSFSSIDPLPFTSNQHQRNQSSNQLNWNTFRNWEIVNLDIVDRSYQRISQRRKRVSSDGIHKTSTPMDYQNYQMNQLSNEIDGGVKRNVSISKLRNCLVFNVGWEEAPCWPPVKSDRILPCSATSGDSLRVRLLVGSGWEWKWKTRFPLSLPFVVGLGSLGVGVDLPLSSNFPFYHHLSLSLWSVSESVSQPTGNPRWDDGSPKESLSCGTLHWGTWAGNKGNEEE